MFLRRIGVFYVPHAFSIAPSLRVAVLLIFGTMISAGAQAAILCTAIADAASEAIWRQEGSCDRRVTPASTFKIAIGLMGYDSGYLIDEYSPRLPFRKGDADWIPSWRQPTDPTGWIKNSVVWYSQRITNHLGELRFRQYVTHFRYGNEDVSGDPGQHNGLSHAWLGSSLQISPLEQLKFLEQIVHRRLGVTARAYDMIGRITRIGTLASGWEVHGKTGTGFPLLPDRSIDEDHAFGWFVGWALKDSRTIVFARLIQDSKVESISAGLRTRDAFMKELPGILEGSGTPDGNR
jgi:beta-lactamase class D